jgi:uncharacterized damage-inducible protein DinB
MGDVLDEYLWELSGLNRRLREVAQGLTSEQLDRAPANDANSIAILVKHAVGSELGWLHLAAGRAHERDRDSEFATKQVEAADLARAVDDAERVAPDLVRAAFAAGLETTRERPGARPVTVAYCLTHAATHLAEHIGHAEVARQVVTERSPRVG